MNQKADWLPQNHEELYYMAARTVAYLTPAVLASIGIAGAAQAWYQDEFIPKYNKFKVSFDNWLNPAERTPIKIAILKSAEKNFKKVYRQLYNGYMKKNPLVMNENLLLAGFRKHSSDRRTSVLPPRTLIKARTETSTPATVIIHYQDANSPDKARSQGVHGAEIVWEILDAPTINWSDLTHSGFDTRTPIRLAFRSSQRGKTLYFAMRWENTRGEKGPWNNIEKVIIP
jgi:hypothetical protein